MRRLLTALSLLLAAVAAHAQAFRFVHVTDTHLTASGNIQPLKELVTQIEAMSPKPAFVVDTGDVTEAGRPEEYAHFLEATTGLSIPFYAAPGNHDVRWGPLGKEGFTHAFKRLYQSFDQGGYHFVVLDSTVLLEHWGHFDSAQLKWLAADLKKVPKESPVLLFFHHWVGREPKMVDNSEELLRLIAPYNVIAMFVGHGHADIKWQVNGIPCFMARGLYQGSYNLVEADTHGLKVYRVRKEAGQPRLIAEIPSHGPARRYVAFGWDDANIPQLARRQFVIELHTGERARDVVTDPNDKAEYDIDGDTPTPIPIDERREPSRKEGHEGRFVARFETKSLTPGTHTLRLRITAADGTVYSREELFGVEAVHDQPRREWGVALGDTIQSSPTLAGGMLYCTSFDGRIAALDPANGKRRWATPAMGSYFATPVVDGGTVYVGSMDHRLYAIDAANGHQRWSFDAGTPLFATAAVANGIVCVGSNRKIYGVDAATGQQKWTVETGGFFQSRAAAADGVFYLGGWDNTVYAVEASSGHLLWSKQMGRSNGGRGALSFYYSPAIASPVVAEGRVFVCTNDGTLHALDAKSGDEAWTAKGAGDSLGYSSPCYAGGRIYVGGLGKNGDCYAFDAKSGAPLWRCSTGAENYDSSTVVAGDFVLIGSVWGQLSWIDRQTGQLRWQYRLDPGFCFTTAAVSGRRVYVTNMANQVTAVSYP